MPPAIRKGCFSDGCAFRRCGSRHCFAVIYSTRAASVMAAVLLDAVAAAAALAGINGARAVLVMVVLSARGVPEMAVFLA